MTSNDPSASPPDWKAIVSELVDAARKAAGNAEALAQRLEGLGVGGERGSRYSMSAISNWARGRTMPPADVLLALAIVSGQSLDERLPGRTGGPSVDGDEVDRMRSEMARLQAEMMHLYSRVGEPYERQTDRGHDDEHLPQTGTMGE